MKDLLEITSYIYIADRKIKRGGDEDIEFHSWSRKLLFKMPVRKPTFWNKPKIKESLVKALTFMSGDLSYEFEFIAGGRDSGQLVLTDSEEIKFDAKPNSCVCLFSGGLDSLAGAISKLKEGKNLILVSHRSSNPTVSSIQEQILNKLIKSYPNRIQHFVFTCNLSGGNRAAEETQRTRVFLYTSIAISLMSLASEKAIYVFENGITSLNFPKRADAINARASRTTHPKTISFLEDFFSLFSGETIKVEHPFVSLTKSEVVNIIKENNHLDFINSTLTCTKTFDRFEHNTSATHCGRCSQCIDRRFAMYANEIEKYDAIYDLDIAKDEINDQEGFTHLLDYLYLKTQFELTTEMSFWGDFSNEIAEVIDFMQGTARREKFDSLFSLIKKHVEYVNKAIKRIRSEEDLSKPRMQRSLFHILDEREHLKEPVERFAEEVAALLKSHIPLAFRTQKPANEQVLNDQIQTLLKSKGFEREFPVLLYATAKTVPDHSKNNLFIEGKYPRNKASQSKITDEIAADITKYGNAYKLFVVYDPEKRISDKDKFQSGIEAHPNCKLIILN
ncbi:MAG: 7-cyano-7-deazaguanine synthase [Bacteroidia bacterium]